MRLWAMNLCGLNDRTMTTLLDCIEAKNRNSKVHFPQLKGLLMQKNYLGTQSIRKIMSMGLPSLDILDF